MTGIDAADVTAIVITKRDVDISLVLVHLNQYFPPDTNPALVASSDFKVYTRYATAMTDNVKFDRPVKMKDVVYVQDDDCIVDISEVLSKYEPGVVTCNIRHTHTDWYTDRFYNVAPVGWGAVFDRALIQPAFDKYLSIYLKDDFFLRECDRVFTGLQSRPVKRITAGCVNLPWAHGKDRMGAEPNHLKDFREVVGRVQHCLTTQEVG